MPIYRRFAAAAAGLFLLAAPLSAQAISKEASQLRAPFSISFSDLTSDLRIMTAMVMPSETLDIRTSAYATANAGLLSETRVGWSWSAPDKPGRHEIEFEKDGERILLNVFVLTPFPENAVELNGYKIGSYTKALFKGLKSYAMPRGFIDLSHGPSSLQITPNFTLGQFICKQQPGHDPAYLLVRPQTLVKLETLLEAANAKGWNADTLHVMSGFRTPAYNAGIGNKTTSSRHLYGGAADVWLDGDGDGQMDDLNGDGKVTKDDARALADLAEQLAQKGGDKWPTGGIGVYGSNAAHGPFIHVDTRGYHVRWGH